MPSPESREICSRLLDAMKSTPQPSSIEEARERTEARAESVSLPPGTVIEAVTASGVPCEWVVPAGAADEGVILHLHSGGYTMGSCRTARLVAPWEADASGVRALTVGYRLAPEHPFPAALQDVVAVYRWLLQRGNDPSRIVLAGDSAGGGLALAAMVLLRDETVPLPAAAVLVSPWNDAACTGASYNTLAEADPWVNGELLRLHAGMYAGGVDLEHPLISPLYADLGGLPPLLIHAGTEEILLDDSTRLAARAREAGVDVTLKVWEGMWHVWHSFAPQLPEALEAIGEIGSFVREKTGAPRR